MLSNSKRLDFRDECYHVYHDKIRTHMGKDYKLCKKCGYWRYLDAEVSARATS